MRRLERMGGAVGYRIQVYEATGQDALNGFQAEVAMDWGTPDVRTIALCERYEDAEQIAALLRFADAMTPEMWDTARMACNDREFVAAQPDERRRAITVKVALDTLRHALEVPRG